MGHTGENKALKYPGGEKEHVGREGSRGRVRIGEDSIAERDTLVGEAMMNTGWVE